MKADATRNVATSFGMPFLVTLLGIGPVALLGSCDNVTTCAAKGFVVGPVLLVAVPVTGFVAGRVSSSLWVGLLAVLAAATLVVSVIVIGGLWYQSPDAGGPIAKLAAVLILTGLTLVLTLPGFVIGRLMHDRAQIARLSSDRDAGRMTSDEFVRRMAALGHTIHDQAPPDHRCARCGKPVRTDWHWKCQHCGAIYAEHPPVPT